jgi:hypothetical protein
LEFAVAVLVVVVRLGLVEPERVLDDLLESVECFLPAFGRTRTHPSGVAKPSGVTATDNSGALLERVCFAVGYSIAFTVEAGAFLFLTLRLCVCAGRWPEFIGTRAREERERRIES